MTEKIIEKLIKKYQKKVNSLQAIIDLGGEIPAAISLHYIFLNQVVKDLEELIYDIANPNQDDQTGNL